MEAKQNKRLTIVGIGVTAVAAIAAVLVVPEVRNFLGLSEEGFPLQVFTTAGEPFDGATIAGYFETTEGRNRLMIPTEFRNASKSNIGPMQGVYYVSESSLVLRERSTRSTLRDGFKYEQEVTISGDGEFLEGLPGNRERLHWCSITLESYPEEEGVIQIQIEITEAGDIVYVGTATVKYPAGIPLAEQGGADQPATAVESEVKGKDTSKQSTRNRRGAPSSGWQASDVLYKKISSRADGNNRSGSRN